MKIFEPTYLYNRITDIDLQKLSKKGIHALLLDVDNTLSTHGGEMPVHGLDVWLREAKLYNVKLIILSNAKKSRVEPFANKLGLGFVSLSLKPLPIGYFRAIKKLGISKEKIAIVGDQIFTDILGAKFSGIKSFLVRPILLEEKMSFKIRRKIEEKIISKMKRDG